MLTVPALGGEAAERAADVDAGDVSRVHDRSRDARRAIEQFLGAELGLLGDALDAGQSAADLGLVGLDGDLVVDAGVGGVHGELADVAQQAVDFGEAAFSGLDDVGGILAVGDGLVEAVDLSAQSLRR